MLVWTTTFILLFARDGYDFVTCQSSGSSFDIQSFLNQFCSPGSTNPGCAGSAVVSPGSGPTTPRPPVTAPPTVRTPRPPVSEGCSASEKLCPQLPGKCVPNNVDCGIIGRVTCPLPKDYGVETQVLICGNGSPLGVRCGDDTTVPVLTLLMVQCQGSNSIRQNHVESFNVLDGPGDDGGAGVYQCSGTGRWERKHGSSIEDLIVSCRDAGCGRLPHPRSDMPVHRRWSWVRAIYKDNKLHCTGTLVSQNALVTAAHCVAQSPVSKEADPRLDNYLVELPGPNDANPIIRNQPTDIFIHPRYSPNDGKFQHDMAVIFFRQNNPQRLPTVCISNQQYRQEVGRAHVVFSLDGERQTPGGRRQPLRPIWKVILASWDHSCLTTAIRTSPRCIGTVEVQGSQFCAAHKGSTLSKGSSGGPYLAEMGQDLEEVWVLMGVLSVTAQITGDGCSQDHSVYGQAADEFRWMKDCVFDGKCKSL